MPRERLELAANKTYWDAKRVPKIDKVVMMPMPEANARTAALLGGQVDWIEAPSPDAMAQITQRGFKIYSNAAAARVAVAAVASPKARPGSTSACARPPTCASTAAA